MSTNESARQTSSTDTNIDLQLDHDSIFAVGILSSVMTHEYITEIGRQQL